MRCILLLLLPWLAGCGNYVIAEHYDYTNLPAGDKPAIIVEMVNGPIKITTIPGKEIFARLTKVGAGRDKQEAEKEIEAMEFEVVPTDGKISFKVKHVDGSKYWHSGCGAEADLQVPNGTKVELVTSNGNITIEGTTGEVIAHSKNGGIHVGRVTGSVQLKTSNANVSVDHVSEFAQIETSNGNINTRGPHVALQCKTTNGDIKHIGGIAAGKNQLTSSNGSITLILPRDANLNLEASTSGSCRVKNDFGLKGSKNSLKATLGKNSTDKLLILKTSNANINIKCDRNGKQTETVVVNDDD